MGNWAAKARQMTWKSLPNKEATSDTNWKGCGNMETLINSPRLLFKIYSLDVVSKKKSMRKRMGYECPGTPVGTVKGNTLLGFPSKILSSSPWPCPGKRQPWQVLHCLILESALNCCSFSLTTSSKNKQEAVCIERNMKEEGKVDLSGKWEAGECWEG